MIHGQVDDYGRALLPLTVAHPATGATAILEPWVDSGFTDALLLPSGQIAALGLDSRISITANLADGTRHTFTTFSCQIDWFGRVLAFEALAGSGQFALIGVRLMEDCTLTIDYPARTVTLSALPGLPSWP
jgi:predicted aspartyl protease